MQKVLLLFGLISRIYLCELLSSPGLRWAWCWWGGPPPDVLTETPESPTTERWCGHKSPLRFYTKERVKGRKKKREKDRKLLRLVLVPGWGCDPAGGGETDIILSDCSTSSPPSLHHTNCFLSPFVHRHARKTPSQQSNASALQASLDARMTVGKIAKLDLLPSLF